MTTCLISGTIQREGEYPEVVKADQVVDQIRALINKRDVSFFSWAMKSNNEDKWDSMNENELKMFTLFLRARHVPRSTIATVEVPGRPAEFAVSVESAALVAPAKEPPAVENSPTDRALTTSRCEHCKSKRLQIKYGHNYFFACLDCAKNTRIDLACPTCTLSVRIRKEKLIFYKECTCGFAEVFFVNPG